jgi:dienelactone hydrolase
VPLFKFHSNIRLLIFGLLLMFALAACGPSTATTTVTEPPLVETQAVTDPASTETSAVTEDVAPASMENPLPADPVAMSFTARDGVELQGTFYPAAEINAPVIVLLHWAPGDQSDWRAIAAWLQNRGLQVSAGGANKPWLDSSWFPEFAEDYSFNVFTFTFRGCEGGCQTFEREVWRLDVEAAMTEVIRMENISRSQVLAIGASIGADGAAYGCHFYNTELGGCQGAFSLSPGGYLDLLYSQEVASLEAEMISRPAWCLYAEGDGESAEACLEATGTLYRAVDYSGSSHGMRLINPEQTPNPLNLILDFIHDYLQCDICAL